MTGPYHSICSMDLILDNYSFYKSAVLNNTKIFIEKYKEHLIYPLDYQPQICTMQIVKSKL